MLDQKIIPSITFTQLFDICKHKIDKNSFSNSYEDQIPIFYNTNDIKNFIKSKNDFIEYIYVARIGNTFDAHIIAEKVLNSGNIFIGEYESILKCFPNNYKDILNHKLFICVQNVKYILYNLLENAWNINRDNFFTIAVTGTNGKTSVTQISADLLNNLYNETIIKIGTLGVQIGAQNLPVSHVTTPDFPSFLNILNIAKLKSINKIIMEYTSHGLKEKRLHNWLVDVAIFTNLTQDHLDYHITMEDYINSKMLLFKNFLKENGTAIINVNNTQWHQFIIAAIGKNRKLIIVGDKNLHNKIVVEFKDSFKTIEFIHIENQISNLNGIQGELVIDSLNSNDIQKSQFLCQLIGDFQFENILCAAGIAHALNFSINNICSTINKIENIPGRLQKIVSKNSQKCPTILVDYAHTPDALEKALLTCKKCLPNSGKITVVFGCGGDRDKSKRKIMGQIAQNLAHKIIVTSDNPRTEDPLQIIYEISHEMTLSENLIREVDRKKAIQIAISNATMNDIVLIAGKGHENYQIIGTEHFPFSDTDVVKSIIDKM